MVEENNGKCQELPWKQGAEGRLFKSSYLGKPCIIKERFKKHYRNPALDEALTRERIRNEVKALVKCRQAGVHAPVVYNVSFKERKIIMENVEPCCTSKEFMVELLSSGQRDGLMKLASEIGSSIGKLHQLDVIHGDLTTSNILIRKQIDKYELTFIDFGLSYMEQSAEDKAVDLYVLERAIVSTLPEAEGVDKVIIAAYVKENKKDGKQVAVKLEEVRLRGRKRLMVG